ncbi:protein transport protein SEC13 [Histoplasma mississippiense (nom. inval.)]|uniref:protein transport protein SEC13 n=1 Tax=Ajellomyces capsulatus (strain NAm1 / WU24) TaxID=2059318 RepID=UPI000157D532|nr:protein transport protein SEC13 [Histoplasma mississippiense (nom. inval.)]EDN05295.1 protein transport protein SEC13 [Histoplasma mississippiense (nom. inval.)]
MPLAPSNQGDAMDIMPSIDIYDTLGYAQVITNSGHDDMIHDAALDYYGRRLATCSSDKTIKIFEVEGDSHRLLETLKGHEGAVWCIAWPPPPTTAKSLFGANKLLAPPLPPPPAPGQKFLISPCTLPPSTASPGLRTRVAACSPVPPPTATSAYLNSATIAGRTNCSTRMAWVSIPSAGRPLPLLVPSSARPQAPDSYAGGENKTYTVTKVLEGHTDWVRDVAWSPSILSKSYIASASQDKTVRIWTSDPSNPNEWTSQHLEFDCVLWRVSWSLSGNVLAISGGDNKVSLWKENLKGQWEKVKDIED